MKFKSTYLTGLIFIAIGAYVYLYEIVGEPARIQAEEEKNRFYVFDTDDVVALKLERPDIAMSFEKRGSDWFITNPVNYEGDKSTIRGLIDVLSRSNKESLISENTAAIEEYGVGANAPTLSVMFKDSSEFSLIVGNENPLGGKVYARMPDDQNVYLSSYALYNRANDELFYYRNKELLDFERNDVTKIVFHNHNQTLEVEKDDDGDWIIKQPLEYEAESVRIIETFNKIRLQKIKSFVEEHPENLRNYGLDNPGRWIEFSLGDSTHSLFFGDVAGSKGDNYYTISNQNNPVFEMDSSTVHYLTPRLFDLRDKKIVGYSSETIDEVHITKDNTQYVFTKEDSTGNWYMTVPENRKANRIRFENVISEFIVNRAVGFIDDPGMGHSRYGLVPPEADYSIYADGAMVEHFQLGKKGEKGRYFYNVTKDQMFLLKFDLYPKLFVPVYDLLEPQQQ